MPCPSLIGIYTSSRWQVFDVSEVLWTSRRQLVFAKVGERDQLYGYALYFYRISFAQSTRRTQRRLSHPNDTSWKKKHFWCEATRNPELFEYVNHGVGRLLRERNPDVHVARARGYP